MLERIKSNPTRQYFFVYCFINIGFGCIISELGPLIPYLSAHFGLAEPMFSFMFMWRSIGFSLGNISAKFMHKYLNYHQILFFCIIGAGLPHIVFPFMNSPETMGLCMLVSSLFLGLLEIYLSLALIVVHRGNHEEFWLQLSHGVGSIGCLASPMLVGIFEIKSFWIIGLVMMTPLYFVWNLRSPELQKQGQEQQDNEVKEQQKISFKVQIFICLTLFILFGQIMGFSGWISTYLVIQQLETKEGGAFMTSIYWIVMTIFIFVLANWKGSPQKKLFTLMKIEILTLLTSIMLQNIGQPKMAAFASTIVLGIANSCMYAMVLSTPLHFGKKLCPSSTSNILIVASMGEGSLSGIFGYGIKEFGPKAFFVQVLIFACMMYAVFYIAVQLLRAGSPEHKEVEVTAEQELQQILHNPLEASRPYPTL